MDFKIIDKYFPQLGESRLQQFEQLQELYSCWNERINVISRKDIEHLYTRHVLHSLAIAKIVSFLPDTQVLDLGTGGGFPAVPLAILFPETGFVAVDSIAKKIKVLENVCKELKLTNVEPKCERGEKLSEKFDFVVARAVTNLSDFFALVRNRIKSERRNALPNGIICLKGGNLDEEIAGMLKTHTLSKRQVIEYNISDFFEEEFFETKKILYLQV